jgi:hypothetical protein
MGNLLEFHNAKVMSVYSDLDAMDEKVFTRIPSILKNHQKIWRTKEIDIWT